MEYLYPLLYGIGTGFLMSILLGVIFFMLIQTGVRYGYKKGISIAAGVITGDLIFVILAISFTGYISSFLNENENVMSLTGGAVLIALAIISFAKKRKLEPLDDEAKKMKNTKDFFVIPFVINLVNPANAAWWLGLFSMPPALHYTLPQKIIFAFGALLTVFTTEVGVAAAASKLSKFITPKVLKSIDTVVGIALLFVGLKLIFGQFPQ